jgi:hypothetical protein
MSLSSTVGGRLPRRFPERSVSEGCGLFRMGMLHIRAGGPVRIEALLHSAGRGEKTHDLTKLWKELSNAGVDLAPELEDVLKRLSRHYLVPRYPDLVPEGEPAGFYGRADADQAFEDAQAVIAEVDRAWSSRDA